MIESIYSRGKQRIEALVAKISNSRKLSSGELNYYKDFSFSDGWAIPHLYEDNSLELRILISKRFPFSAPRIAVWPSPPVLSWPHLEKFGLLCLASNKFSTSITQIEDVLRVLLFKADELIKDSLEKKLDSDFIDEFSSYWERWENYRPTPIVLSLLTSKAAQGTVAGFWAKNRIYIADSKEALSVWLTNYYGKEVKDKFEKVFLFDLKRPFYPSEFPSNAKEAVDLIFEQKPLCQSLKNFLLNKSGKDKVIVYRYPWFHGSGYFSLGISRQHFKIRGFRDNTFAPSQLQLNYALHQDVYGIGVERCDHDWIHGRSYNMESKKLIEKKVWILGLGSVGSGLVEMLSKAGIGKFVLVDPESVEPANISRHILGLNSAFRNKAKALAEKLRCEFPHLSFSYFEKCAEDLLTDNEKSLEQPDLIISAIGEWGSEAFVSSLIRTRFPRTPVIFVWLEPHASVGHAAVFINSDSCLGCLLDDVGRLRISVTKWDEEQILKKIPACGGEFQPYGAIELGHSISMFAEMSLKTLLETDVINMQHIWIGKKRILEKNGGLWNPEWEAKHGNTYEGGKFVSLPILQDSNCPICGKR